jgi:hypothetical protein
MNEISTQSRSNHISGRIGLTTLTVLALAGIANAQTPTDGVFVLQNLTSPSGGVWLATSSGGGHWWQTDSVLGICRVDPLGALWQLTNCNGAVKSGGQAVLANIGPGYPTAGVPTGAKFVFVPDSSTKSTQVLRFLYNPAGEGTLSNPLVMTVPNVAGAHGGTQGGRAAAAAMAPNGVDLYVGYTKSGDIMQVADATNTTSQKPVVTQIGETSDTLGVRSMVLHNGDLYLAEMGGLGLSRIHDPAGLTRAPCGPTAPCTAATLSPNVSSFPGGLASDGTYVYVGDSPLTTPGSILRYDPVTLTVTTYSLHVPPYTSTFDGVQRSQYVNPFGLAFAPNGDLYVADDPTTALAIPVVPTLQGHLWRVPKAANPPTVTSLQLTSGGLAGGDTVGIVGTGFSTIPGAAQVFFGSIASPTANCDSTTHCFALSPPSAGPGTVDVRVFIAGMGSAITPGDRFTYVANSSPGAPIVTSISPNSGALGGGTVVTINGINLAGGFVTFGLSPASNVVCGPTSCTATSPAGTGTVDVQVTNALALTSAANAGDRFTYAAPSASLYAWGITAPKGGMVWVPGALSGHWWSSDHAAGFCRQDAVAGANLHAINRAVCDNGSVGSPGQAVYDARPAPCTAGFLGPCHYIYVPDNAVKSTAVWRLTFDEATETVAPTTEAMLPLADVRTLKPNGMALGPDGNLYVTDLVELNIRKVTGPNGDPRLQTVSIVAVTGDGRGANGTIGFIGNKLYISENRAAAWFDITAPCATGVGAPCATTPIPLPSGAFVAGVATDPVNGFVYASDSPGAAASTIWRHNVATGITTMYLMGGTLPAAGTPESRVWVTQTATRAWDPLLAPGGTCTFAFTFGLNVGPDGSLYITEDPTAGARAGRGHAWVSPLLK